MNNISSSHYIFKDYNFQNSVQEKNEDLNLFSKNLSCASNSNNLKKVSRKVQANEYLKKAHILGLRRLFYTFNEIENLQSYDYKHLGMWYGRKDLYEEQFSFPSFLKDWFETYNGHLNDKYFDQNHHYEWQKDEDADASKALEKIFEGPSRLECTSGTFVYYAYALKEMIGEKKFDQLFGSSGNSPLLEPLKLSRWADVNSIEFFLESAQLKTDDVGQLNNRPLEVGDWCYFEGVKDYLNRHIKGGNGCGVNVIYIGKNSKGEQLFIGFDFDYAVTENDIYRALINLYLLPPVDAYGELVSKKGPAQTPTFDDVIGFKPSETKRFNYALIEEIKTNTLSPEFIEQLKAKGFFKD